MSKFIFFITSFVAPILAFATSWSDPTWEEMISDAELIGLFEVVEGGHDDAVIEPIKLLKGTITTNIIIQGFNNNCASSEWQNERALKAGEQAYLFVYNWRGNYGLPTPSTGLYRPNSEGLVPYFTFGPTSFVNLPQHPVSEFEQFIANTVWFQKHGTPNTDTVMELRETIRDEIIATDTNSLPDHLVYYRLWGARDWIEGFESITNNPAPATRYHAAQVLGEMPPSQNTKKLLLNLLDDSNTMVQGQAVDALMKSTETDSMLALLTKKLGSSAPGGMGPSNIMNPIMNNYLGGQLAIIQQIREHNYIDATNELVSVARSTQNAVVLAKAFRTLDHFESPALSEILAHQLASTNRHLVGEAIRLCRDIPRPVENHVRIALEHALTDHNLDSYETELVFNHFTVESLPAIVPKIETILARDKPKWHDEEYLIKAIELTGPSAPPKAHEMVDRILHYWVGVDPRALSAPQLLKKKIELERHYSKRVVATKVIDAKKYKTKAEAFVRVDFARASSEPNAMTPPHSFCVQLEMTVPANDPENPFPAIHTSYEDRSKTSPLKTWRMEIAKETNLPENHVGIFCHPSSGRGGSIDGSDQRIGNSRKIIRAYSEYAKRTKQKKANELLRLLLKSGLAKHMGCSDIIREARK